MKKKNRKHLSSEPTLGAIPTNVAPSSKPSNAAKAFSTPTQPQANAVKVAIPSILGQLFKSWIFKLTFLYRFFNFYFILSLIKDLFLKKKYYFISNKIIYYTYKIFKFMFSIFIFWFSAAGVIMYCNIYITLLTLSPKGGGAEEALKIL